MARHHAGIEKPEAVNFVLGQTHFIKSVEDLHEARCHRARIKFGPAFCEASGKCPVRWSGTDEAMIDWRAECQGHRRGHCFILFLGEGFYPINVLNTVKTVPEVCRIFCRPPTRPKSSSPRPIKAAASWAWSTAPRPGGRGRGRHCMAEELLRQIGYKL